LRRDTERRPGFREPLVKRMNRGAVFRCDSEMQRIAGAKSKRMLIGKFRATRNCPPVTPRTVKLSATSLLNRASAAARCSRLICPVRSLIAMAEDNSVTVQSLISSYAGSCSASHA
jgi:hypothetical protein